LATYLLEKDTSVVAHKLQGEILEKLGQPEKALPAYKKAHELEASADLVNRICRIMADLPVEPGRAKYWVEVRSPGGLFFPVDNVMDLDV
jgi:hypothetical protein